MKLTKTYTEILDWLDFVLDEVSLEKSELNSWNKEYLENIREILKNQHPVDLNFYRQAFQKHSETLNEITTHLLGKNWYACNTGGLFQVDPIIVSEIKKRYKSADSHWYDFIKNIYENIKQYIYFKL